MKEIDTSSLLGDNYGKESLSVPLGDISEYIQNIRVQALIAGLNPLEYLHKLNVQNNENLIPEDIYNKVRDGLYDEILTEAATDLNKLPKDDEHNWVSIEYLGLVKEYFTKMLGNTPDAITLSVAYVSEVFPHLESKFIDGSVSQKEAKFNYFVNNEEAKMLNDSHKHYILKHFAQSRGAMCQFLAKDIESLLPEKPFVDDPDLSSHIIDNFDGFTEFFYYKTINQLFLYCQKVFTEQKYAEIRKKIFSTKIIGRDGSQEMSMLECIANRIPPGHETEFFPILAKANPISAINFLQAHAGRDGGKRAAVLAVQEGIEPFSRLSQEEMLKILDLSANGEFLPAIFFTPIKQNFTIRIIPPEETRKRIEALFGYRSKAEHSTFNVLLNVSNHSLLLGSLLSDRSKMEAATAIIKKDSSFFTKLSEYTFYDLFRYPMTPEEAIELVENSQKSDGTIDLLQLFGTRYDQITDHPIGTFCAKTKSLLQGIVSENTSTTLFMSTDINKFYIFLTKRSDDIAYVISQVFNSPSIVLDVFSKADDPSSLLDSYLESLEESHFIDLELKRRTQLAVRIFQQNKEEIIAKWEKYHITISDIAGKKYKPDEIDTELFTKLIEEQLWTTSTIDRNTKNCEDASIRNKEFVESINRNGFPSGTMFHASRESRAGNILSIGNFAGECTGKIISHDLVPFCVDTYNIHSNSVKFDNLRKGLNPIDSYGNVIFCYPCIDGHNNTFPIAYSQDTTGWYAIFGSISKTLVGALLYRMDSADNANSQLEELKASVVQGDIYIPIFSMDGVSLFPYEEYELLRDKMKPYHSIEEILADDSYLEAYQTFARPGHEHSLKNHLLLAQQEALRFAKESNLTKPFQNLIGLAARLHDVGAGVNPDGMQAVTNIAEASKILKKIRGLTSYEYGIILHLIRYDELLGTILSNSQYNDDLLNLSPKAESALNELNTKFVEPQLRQALVCLYRADVLSIGNGFYKTWEIDRKLKSLGLI